jgi:hypothetical protein
VRPSRPSARSVLSCSCCSMISGSGAGEAATCHRETGRTASPGWTSELRGTASPAAEANQLLDTGRIGSWTPRRHPYVDCGRAARAQSLFGVSRMVIGQAVEPRRSPAGARGANTRRADRGGVRPIRIADWRRFGAPTAASRLPAPLAAAPPSCRRAA